MNVIYSDQDIPKHMPADSIFLAGPTPRSSEVLSWRPEALEILDNIGFDGTVFIPEWKTWEHQVDFITQVEWEWTSLAFSGTIVIWVPRDLKDMPAFTTNVEFGYWLARRPSRVIYGRPTGSPGTDYLDWLYNKETGCQAHDDLETLLKEVQYRNMSP